MSAIVVSLAECVRERVRARLHVRERAHARTRAFALANICGIRFKLRVFVAGALFRRRCSQLESSSPPPLRQLVHHCELP